MNNDLRLRASSACPRCGRRHVVDLHPVLTAKPLGSHSLSGNQLKVSAVQTWAYTCTHCGATGPCQAPGDLDQLASLPRADCGHVHHATHYPDGDDHRAHVCPGCCPGCQRVRDTQKGLR